MQHFRTIFRIAPDKQKFRIKLWFPHLKMTAKYNIHGKLMLLPLAGHGGCKGNFCKYTHRKIVYFKL